MNAKNLIRRSGIACLTILLTTAVAYGQAWLPLGNNLPADEVVQAVDVSANGTTVALGSPLNGNNVGNQGTVKVYDWTGSSWVQKGSTLTGDNLNDNLGFSVALNSDGNTVVIGTPGDDDFYFDGGKTDVYTWNNGAWQQRGTSILGEADDGLSGRSVSLSAAGNILAIGAFNAPGNGMIQAGNVRIFQWDGTDWAQLGSTIAGEAQGDRSGYSIELSTDGTIIAIGAYTNAGGGSSAGQVRVFTFDGADWVQRGGDIDGATGERFGRRVSLSGDGNRLVSGAPLNFQDNTGLARVYEWDGSNWAQMGSDFIGANDDAELGAGVALNEAGTILAIGSPGYEGALPNNGQVKIYTWQNNSWVEASTTVTGSGNGRRLGRDVVMSASGNLIGITSGADVKVFERAGSTSTNQIAAEKRFVATLVPNPAKQQFTVNTEEEVLEIVLRDTNGRQLKQTTNEGAIDISDLPTGIYLVSIKTTLGLVVKRLVKTQ